MLIEIRKWLNCSLLFWTNFSFNTMWFIFVLNNLFTSYGHTTRRYNILMKYQIYNICGLHESIILLMWPTKKKLGWALTDLVYYYLLLLARVWLIPFNFEFIFSRILEDVDVFILNIVLDLMHCVRTPTSNSDFCLTVAKTKLS